MIILDTNVISELMKSKGDQTVYNWVAQQEISSLFTTTITQAEILYGVALLPYGKRRNSLNQAAQLMFKEDFAQRILTFDSDAAIAFAKIATQRKENGNPISKLDAQIAAICYSNNAQLATRDISDFQGCEISVINPWTSLIT